MKTRFVDTWFYIALLDSDDHGHERALAFALEHPDDFFVTTRWVLAETANALGATRLRQQAGTLLHRLESDPSTVIIASSDELYQRGLDLFRRRADKNWSLTDCISFVVMRDQALEEALTADHHFSQAGFRPVLAD